MSGVLVEVGVGRESDLRRDLQADALEAADTQRVTPFLDTAGDQLIGEPALRADELTRRFGRVTALQEVTLAVPTGSICAVLGPNGAGKTTLLRLVRGELSPGSGALVLEPHGARVALRSRRRSATKTTRNHGARWSARVRARGAALHSPCVTRVPPDCVARPPYGTGMQRALGVFSSG